MPAKQYATFNSNASCNYYIYTLLFHSLFKVEFDMDHFALGEHRER